MCFYQVSLQIYLWLSQGLLEELRFQYSVELKLISAKNESLLIHRTIVILKYVSILLKGLKNLSADPYSIFGMNFISLPTTSIGISSSVAAAASGSSKVSNESGNQSLL